jgi:periplasmic protein TonB
MNPAIRLVVNIGRFIAACVISFLFFIGISKLHAMIDLGHQKDDEAKKANKVLIEMVRKPPEKQEKKTAPKLRKVTKSSNDNKSLGNRTSMKFVPDLNVDAGAGGEGAGVVQVDKTQDLQVEIFEEGETDERPIPLDTRPIAYPLQARERGIEGKLVVYFVIGHNGRVKSVDVQESPSPIITREAKRTIRRWRFKPGKKKGIPVNVRAKKEIDFVLRK